MPKITGFIALHYGKEYLSQVIHQIYPVVDEIIIAYTSKPSHGQTSTLQCPDSRKELIDAAFLFGDNKNKIKWHDGSWSHEGQQRDMVFNVAKDSNLIAVFDSDEIWHTDQLQNTIDWCFTQPVRNFKQKLMTPWRSFNWVCCDEMRPDRFYRPDMPKDKIAYVPEEISIFYHMGYSICNELMSYKISCHGHLNEWDKTWFNEKWSKWSPINNIQSLHPTCKNTWNAIPFNKNLLPAIMKTHKYWDKEII